MTENKEIPKKVINAFSELIDIYGNRIEELGEVNDKRYFWFNIPEDIDYGFPQVVYLQNKQIKDVDGFEALKILSMFNPED